MVKTSKKLCFVIGPIGRHKSAERAHADLVLKKIVKPTFAKHFKEFKVERADHIARPGMIDSQVITNLIEADLVIADLTGRNANAFYELGIRHMLQKPVIHLFRRGDDIPADVAPYRAIEFSYEDKWEVRDAKIALRKMVAEVIVPNFYIENPVTRSPGFIRMQEAKPARQRRVKSAPRTKPESDASSPVLDNAPGVIWKKRDGLWEARWYAPEDALKRGYPVRSLRLWSGSEKDLDKTAKAFISDRANVLQAEFYQWDDVGNQSTGIITDQSSCLVVAGHCAAAGCHTSNGKNALSGHRTSAITLRPSHQPGRVNHFDLVTRSHELCCAKIAAVRNPWLTSAFPAKADKLADIAVGPLCARSGLMHCSNSTDILQKDFGLVVPLFSWGGLCRR